MRYEAKSSAAVYNCCPAKGCFIAAGYKTSMDSAHLELYLCVLPARLTGLFMCL